MPAPVRGAPALHYHPLPDLAETLAAAAGLPLGEREALAEAQRAFISLAAGAEDPAERLRDPRLLVDVLETCFTAGLDPAACAALHAAAARYLSAGPAGPALAPVSLLKGA